MSYRCKDCNSIKVEQKCWVQHNTGKVMDTVKDRSIDNWCPDCQELVEIYDDDLMFKDELAIQLGWSYELWEGDKRLGDDNKDTYYWYDQEGNAYTEEEFDKLKKEDL